MAVERLQAAAGGMNTDASPDYVGVAEAVLVQNLLTGRAGKTPMRGPLVSGADITAGASAALEAAWTYNGLFSIGDFVLIRVAGSPDVFWSVDLSTMTATNVTSTIAKTPSSSVHVRYGDSVYGAVDDANTPALASWNGVTTLALQTNAPFKFTDLQVHAERLFVLGGTVPGAGGGTTVNAKTLYYTDPGATDLTLLTTWKDDVSGLVNQINFQSDDTPVGLAGCGKYLAILGSRSISILTGTGSSSFAIRNLTKSWGCTSRESILEVDDGFYFLSDRGYCFCDGSTVSVVSRQVNDQVVGGDTANVTATMLERAYIALCFGSTGTTWLYHIASQTWSQLTSARFPSTVPYAVTRTNLYPLVWDGRNLWRAESLTSPDETNAGTDRGAGGATVAIPARVKTRIARLASPSSNATIKRVLVDSSLGSSSAAWSITLRDGHDTSLATGSAAGQASGTSRNRAQFDAFAESDVAYLDIAYSPTGTPTLTIAELYDAWLEYQPGRDTPGF